MLDTSIRTGEVYVMNVKSITDRYNRALGYTPAVAALVATLTLFINFFVPLFVGIFDSVAASRLEESVELTSVYGVALGTILVFIVIAGMFAINSSEDSAVSRKSIWLEESAGNSQICDDQHCHRLDNRCCSRANHWIMPSA